MEQGISFSEMPLSDGMKETIKQIGFLKTTPIQEKSIPLLLEGHDLLGEAQTGTGKTAAFSIPIIEMLQDGVDHIQALIICPTRELCLQVCGEVERLSDHKKGVTTVALYGGQPIDRQLRSLKSAKPAVVVATPGRLFDHVRRKSVNLSKVTMIILDEADEMLDMGFRPEIESVFELLPQENQRVFFSATMPKAIKSLACSFLREPQIVRALSKTVTATKVTQKYFKVRGKEKMELLCRVLHQREPKLAVVFCNSKSAVDDVVDEIKNRGFEAGALHGDLSQTQRDRIMRSFRKGGIRVLVATDIAARGIDVDDVELVVNYHLPHDPEDYVHRIGRTGRAGKSGLAFSLVEPRDNSRLRRISQFAKAEMIEETPPSITAVKSAKMKNIIHRLKDALDAENIDEYRAFLREQNLSSEDVAVGMFRLALKSFDDHVQSDEIFDKMKSAGRKEFFEGRSSLRKDRNGGRRRRRFDAGSRFGERRDRIERSRGSRPLKVKNSGPSGFSHENSKDIDTKSEDRKRRGSQPGLRRARSRR